MTDVLKDLVRYESALWFDFGELTFTDKNSTDKQIQIALDAVNLLRQYVGLKVPLTLKNRLKPIR